MTKSDFTRAIVVVESGRRRLSADEKCAMLSASAHFHWIKLISAQSECVIDRSRPIALQKGPLLLHRVCAAPHSYKINETF